MSEERRQAQEAGAQVVTTLHGVTRALSLYESNNSAVVRQTEQLQKALDDFLALDEELRIQLRQDEFFVNGRLLRVDPVLYERAADLSRILANFQVGDLRFARGFDEASLTAFTADLARSIRGGSSKLQTTYGTLTLAEGAGRSMASLRLNPDRLAIWTYASLLDLTRRLYSRWAQGEAPPLVPLRRALQLAIDGSRELGSLYQMLAVWGPPNPEPAHMRVAVALDAICMSHGLGLTSNPLMTVALGGLLGGLAPDGASGDEAVRPLFRYPGLGRAAVPLVLAVYDTREALTGRPAALHGSLLATLELYHRRIASGRYAPHVLRELRAPMADQLRLFKGSWPIGTVVNNTLSTGARPALVVGANPVRLLAIGEDGQPGAPVETGTLSDPQDRHAPPVPAEDGDRGPEVVFEDDEDDFSAPLT